MPDLTRSGRIGSGFHRIIEGLYQADGDPDVFGRMRGRGALVIDVAGCYKVPPDEWGITYVRWPFPDLEVPDEQSLWALARLGGWWLTSGRPVVAMCSAGVNRSGLMAALILMANRRVSGTEAIDIVRRGNRHALLNEHFTAYLRRLDVIRSR